MEIVVSLLNADVDTLWVDTDMVWVHDITLHMVRGYEARGVIESVDNPKRQSINT